MALTLGRLTVLSALGEPLQAEIEIPSISNEEAASLKATVAPAAAFAAAGLEYNPAVAGVQAALARKADGTAFIRLSSARTIDAPFVDLILDTSWASGRLLRDYTMLFEAPTPKQADLVPTPPQAPVMAPAPLLARPVRAPEGVSSSDPAPASSVPQPPASPPVANKPSNAPETQQVKVKPGDTAGKLALRAKAPDVSLDQMLVAMLRTNPDAFDEGNLNRLRAGVVLDLPSAEQALQVPALEATQTVMAQSKDFDSYRRGLADIAPKTAPATAERKASGAVQAQVEDSKAAASEADKLMLSKGALQDKADVASIAKQRAEKDAADRAAELAKNIADLKQLSAASAPEAAPASAPPASEPATAAPQVEAATLAAASAPVPAASVAAPEASAPASAVSAPEAAASAPEDGGLRQGWLPYPKVQLGGVGLLALLGGYLWYRRWQSKKQLARADSAFLEDPKPQPPLADDASAVQAPPEEAANVAAATEGGRTPDPDFDVDPVAEADVYLAYGRDVQAENILKEALLHDPERLAIHSKLLEIYAKRNDAAGFMASANAALQLTGADSPAWASICEQGLAIDPDNPLYQRGAASGSPLDTLQADATPPDSVMAALLGTEAPLPDDAALDLDLDFSAEEAAPDSASAELDTVLSDALDFGPSDPGTDAPAIALDMPQSLRDLSLDLDGLDLAGDLGDMPRATPDASAPGNEAANAFSDDEDEDALQEPPADMPSEMMEFDLGSLSLDLEPGIAGAAAAEGGPDFDDGSLQTKLALAEEFVSIGDQDGARALIEEVVAEAQGELLEKAQRALANLR